MGAEYAFPVTLFGLLALSLHGCDDNTDEKIMYSKPDPWVDPWVVERTFNVCSTDMWVSVPEDCEDYLCGQTQSRVDANSTSWSCSDMCELYPGDCDNVTECPMLACAVDGRAYSVPGSPALVAHLVQTSNVSDWAIWPGRQVCAEDSDHWRRVGLAEHASVASFSRAVLHLMAHGAPAALVDGTLVAARDEVEHARMAFALAGGELVPGELPLQNDPTPMYLPLQEVAQKVFEEGCFHETHAVLRAAAGLADAHGDALTFLTIVTTDERRHAELAWRTVAWAQSRGAKVVLPSGIKAAESGTKVATELITQLLKDLGSPDFEALLPTRFDDAFRRVGPVFSDTE